MLGEVATFRTAKVQSYSPPVKSWFRIAISRLWTHGSVHVVTSSPTSNPQTSNGEHVKGIESTRNTNPANMLGAASEAEIATSTDT